MSYAETTISRPLTEGFPGIQIKTCRVHILRALRRFAVEIFGQTPAIPTMKVVQHSSSKNTSGSSSTIKEKKGIASRI